MSNTTLTTPTDAQRAKLEKTAVHWHQAHVKALIDDAVKLESGDGTPDSSVPTPLVLDIGLSIFLGGAIELMALVEDDVSDATLDYLRTVLGKLRDMRRQKKG